MKKYLLLLLITFTTITAQTTEIQKISIDGKIISGNIDQVQISEGQSLKLYFKGSITGSYKIMVNAKPVSAAPVNEQEYEFTELSVGDHLIWIEARSNTGDAYEPAKIKVTVTEAAADSASPDILSILLTVLIFFGVPAGLYFFIKNLKEKKIKNKGSGDQEIKVDMNRSRPALSEEYDINYEFEKLKKEFENLKQHNIDLSHSVEELHEYIKELEQINVQLIDQKERLLASNQKLQDLQTKKEELFAIAIHDIKNPASAIKGFVDLLESYDLNANEQQEIIQSLVETSTQIVNLTQSIAVEIANAKSEMTLKKSKSSLKQIIDTVYKRNFAYAKKKNIKFLNQSSDSLPQIDIDAGKIEEVTDNLVNNAIKYSPQGSIVHIRGYFNEEKIIVEVEDNGVGLSEKDIQNAFKKGLLLTPEPTGDETRSGLGLWISKKIIEDHEGKVFLRSKLGAGSTFGFELPYSNQK